MHAYYTCMYCLQSHLSLQVLGNFWNEPKVYMDATIYFRRISPNMMLLDALTLLATVSEFCGNGLTTYGYI